MTILVTGGCGFVGTHLCRRLIADGHAVRVLAQQPDHLAVLDDLPITSTIGDITDPAAMAEAVAGCDAVIHTAASIQYWKPFEAEIMRVNVDGTRIVAEASLAAGVKRMVFVSSILGIAMAEGPDQPADETKPFDLAHTGQPYPLSKMRAERALAEVVEQGLDAVTVNPANIFGPGPKDYHGAEMMRKVRATRVVPYYSGGFCIVHVEDVVDGIVRALERGTTGARYILGGENMTYLDIVQRTADRLGLERRFIRVPPWLTGLLMRLQIPQGKIQGRPPKFTREVHYLINRWRYYDWSTTKQDLGYDPRGFDDILEECLHLGAV